MEQRGSRGRGAWRARGQGDRVQLTRGLQQARGTPLRSQELKNSPIREMWVNESNVPARRRMENMASVSRSSGLDKDGDTWVSSSYLTFTHMWWAAKLVRLKDFRVQEEYREFIQEKVLSIEASSVLAIYIFASGKQPIFETPRRIDRIWDATQAAAWSPRKYSHSI